MLRSKRLSIIPALAVPTVTHSQLHGPNVRNIETMSHEAACC